jgi:hypothetical protein
MRQQVIAQVRGICPVEMLPTRRAPTGFIVHGQTQRDNIVTEHIPARWHTVAQSAVEIEENRFYTVRRNHADMLL